MKNIKLNNKVKEWNDSLTLGRLAIFICLLLPYISYSQTTQHIVAQEWMNSSGSQNSFRKSTVRTAAFGGSVYTYVCGSTLNSSGNFDILVQRFSPIGTLMWQQSYNGAGNGDDIGTDIRISSNNGGEIYVCGTYYKDATDSNNAIIIKYDQYGNQRWSSVYNGTGSKNDAFASLLVNGAAVIAVGSAFSGSNQYDMITQRVDTAGTTIWRTLYDNVSLNDAAVSLSSRSGAIFVSGVSQSAATTYKIATWKIDPTTGAITTTTLSSGTAFGIDRVSDVQEDASGNVYVAGTELNISTGYDIKLFKFDNTLANLWSASWDGNSLEDGATGLYIDSLDNVVVTGYTTTTSNDKDYITIKYNSGGTQQWAAQYDDTAHGCDSATAIVTKGTNIYITGKSYNGQNSDYYTLKYDGSGSQIFGIDWNSTPNKFDVPTGIAIDTIGGIVVSGETELNDSTYNYFTIKYSDRDVKLIPDTVAMASVNSQFVENRGQVRDQYMNSDSKVRYYCRSIKPEICLLDQTTTSFVLATIDGDSTTQDTITRVDLTYAGSKKVSPMAYGVSDVMSSYYLSFIPGGEGAVRIHQYNHIIYPEIYPNIDLDFASVEGGANSFYVIKPGGHPSDIKGVFSGASSVTISGNDVLVTIPGSSFTLPQATAFQVNGSGAFVSLGWQPTYSINGSGQLEFTSLGSYDTTKTLIFSIQHGPNGPASVSSIGNLVASTFVGGSLDEVFYDVEHVGGWRVAVGSTRSIPFALNYGQIHSNYYGTGDGFIASYSTSSSVLWAYTFIGGNGEDEFTSVITDYTSSSPYDKFFFAGNTTSTGMLTSGSSTNGNYYQSTKQGFKDGFIGNFNTSFNVSPWRTYFGGSGDESINSLSWANNNLYFTGVGSSASPLKTEAGAYNSNGGTILIGKFDTDDSLVWNTLYGNGTGKSIFRTGNKIVVAGVANGYTLPIRLLGGSYVKTVSDGDDAFVARFNPATDTIIWSTYYGGTGSDDAKRTVIDINGNIYLTGTTTSSDSMYYNTSPIAYVDSTLSGASDAFFAKFDSTGVRLWSTYFGGEYREDGADVDIDYWNDVYFFGFTSSDSMFTLHANTLYNQPHIGGNPANVSTWGDGYIVMLRPTLQPVWSTYFGGNFIDAIHAGCINSSTSTMFIAGYAGSLDSSSFPIAGSGAQWSNTGWGNNDAFSAYLNINQIYTVSVEENAIPILDPFSIYPNPNNGQFIVNIGKEKASSLTVTNALGQIVFIQNKPQTDNNGLIYLDLHNLSQGIYFVNLSYGNNSQTQKFSLIR